MKKILCLITAFIMAGAYMTAQPVYAENDSEYNGEQLAYLAKKAEKYNCEKMYEFPVSAMYHNENEHEEMKLYCSVAINDEGAVIYRFFSDDDYELAPNSVIYPEKFTMEYERPEWYAKNRVSSDTWECDEEGILIFYNTDSERFEFSTIKNVSVRKHQFIGGYSTYSVDTEHDERGNVFYYDEDRNHIYFNDTISVTINDVKLTKGIGGGWSETKPVITYPETRGDADGNGVVNAGDLVCFQHWLLDNAEGMYRPDADLNEDGKLNIVDYLLLKEILLNR